MKRPIQILTLLFFATSLCCFVAYKAGYFHSTPQSTTITDEYEEAFEYLPAPSTKSGVVIHDIDVQRQWKRMRYIADKKIKARYDSLDLAMKKWELKTRHERIAKWDQSLQGRFMTSPKSGIMFDQKGILVAMFPGEYYKWDSTQLMHHIVAFELLKATLWDSVQVVDYIQKAKQIKKTSENSLLSYPDPLRRWQTLESAQADSLYIMQSLRELQQNVMDTQYLKGAYIRFSKNQAQLDSMWSTTKRLELKQDDFFSF